MSKQIYEHKTQGRTLVSLFFLVVSIAAVVLGANSGAPIYWYIPVGFALLISAWWFMNNPNHGCRLTEETLETWDNKNTNTFQLSDIASVQVKEWMDGPDTISFLMSNGEKTEISHIHYGNSNEFRGALEMAGLKTETVS